MAELSDQEMLRYNRQIILRGFDFDGQEALKDSRVLVVGLGGLGCAASQYLASAGVGNLTLLDFDTVSLSNCNARRCTVMLRSGNRSWTGRYARHADQPTYRDYASQCTAR